MRLRKRRLLVFLAVVFCALFVINIVDWTVTSRPRLEHHDVYSERKDGFRGHTPKTLVKSSPTVVNGIMIGQRSRAQPFSRTNTNDNQLNQTNRLDGDKLDRTLNTSELNMADRSSKLGDNHKKATRLNSSQNIASGSAKIKTLNKPLQEQHRGVALKSDGKSDVDGTNGKTDGIRNRLSILQKTNPLHSDRIINPHPYRILKNPSACSQHAPEGKVFLLILVACRPEEDKDRRWIRDTWGGIKVYRGKHILTRFLVGWPLKMIHARRLVVEESALYGDMIQEDFIDTYRTMTHKVLMGLKWAAHICPNASYVMNVDSDMFVNVFRLVRRLEEAPPGSFAEGHFKGATEPRRVWKFVEKWYTPIEIYPESTYPPYLNGPAYVMSGDLPGRIFNESAHVRYLPWDDVYMGLVMKKLGVALKDADHYEDYPQKWDNATILELISKATASCMGHRRYPSFVLGDVWGKFLEQYDNYVYSPPPDSRFKYIAN